MQLLLFLAPFSGTLLLLLPSSLVEEVHGVQLLYSIGKACTASPHVLDGLGDDKPIAIMFLVAAFISNAGHDCRNAVLDGNINVLQSRHHEARTCPFPSTHGVHTIMYGT